MTVRDPKHAFASRPSTADAWVRAPKAIETSAPAYTARLTIDVTPALRGRIKVTAFRRGQTVADMLRALLDREFPVDGADSGAAS